MPHHSPRVLQILSVVFLLLTSLPSAASQPEYIKFGIGDVPELRDDPDIRVAQFRNLSGTGELIFFEPSDPGAPPDPMQACNAIFDNMQSGPLWFTSEGSIQTTTYFVRWEQDGQPYPIRWSDTERFINLSPDDDYFFGSCIFKHELYYADVNETFYNTITVPLHVQAPCGPIYSFLQEDLSCGLEEPSKIPDCDKGKKCNTVGNPCDPASGNKFQQEDDYKNPAIGLDITRYYNSGEADKDIGFGYGWRGLGISKLEINNENDIVFRAADGKGTSFTCTGGNCSAAPSVKSSLGVSASGWRVNHPDGGYSIYNETTGNITRKVSASGQSTYYHYNTAGRLNHISGWAGHDIFISYNASNRINMISTPAGDQILYSYSSNDNLLTASYPDNSGRRYHYENTKYPHHLTGISIIRPDGSEYRYATWAFDVRGRAVSSEHALTSNVVPQEQVFLSYPNSSRTVVTDADGREQVFKYKKINGITSLLSHTWSEDGKGFINNYRTDGKISSRIDAEGRRTEYAYNPAGQRSQVVENADGAATGTPVRTTNYQYLNSQSDKLMKISRDSVMPGMQSITEIHYPGVNDVDDWCIGEPATQACAITKSGYAPDGLPVSRTIRMRHNSNGQILLLDGPRTDVDDTTRFEYHDCTTGNECGQLKQAINPLGHTTFFDDYTVDGRVGKIIDSNGLVSLYTYNTHGQVASITRTAPDGTSHVTSYQYTSFGKPSSITLADGNTISYTYDSAHDLRKVTDSLGNSIEYDYDSRGNRNIGRTIDPDGTLVRNLGWDYGLRGRLSAINAGTSTTAFLRDAVGNITNEADPNTVSAGGQVTSQSQYDPFNRMIEAIDRLGGVTEYQYNVHNRITQARAANNATTHYSYDDLGNLLQETSADRGTTSYTHDAAGNVITRIDALGITTTYSYDALNRLTGIDYPDTVENTSILYDACEFGIGRRCSTYDASGTTNYTYDAFGNTVTVIRTELGQAYITRYQYDAMGRVTTMDYPDDRRIIYNRNIIGNIKYLHASLNGAEVPIIQQMTHSADSLLREAVLGNGLTIFREYDNQGRIVSNELPSTSPQKPADGLYVVMAPDQSSPQPAGSTVTFTAQAQGDSILNEYQFSLAGPATGYQTMVMQPYSMANTFNWTPSELDVGTSTISVDARQFGSTSASEAQTSTTFDINPIASGDTDPATGVTFDSDLASPQAVGNTITFTAQGMGGSGNYEYRFSAISPATFYEQVVVQDYSSNNAYIWTPLPTEVGFSLIIVDVRVVGSSQDYEVAGTIYYDITDTSASLLQDPSFRLIGLPDTKTLVPTEPSILVMTRDTSALSLTPEYIYWVKSSLTHGQWLAVRDYSNHIDTEPDTVAISEVDGLTIMHKLTRDNGSVDYRYQHLEKNTGLKLSTLSGSVSPATLEIFDYGYDDNGNILDYTSPAGSYSFSYDALNRITGNTTPAASHSYSYDSNSNRLTDAANSYSYAAASNRLKDSSGTALTLDANGRLIDDGQGRTFVYGQSGRLKEVYENGQWLASYVYNAYGQRSRKQTTQGTVIYHYDLAGQLIAETTDSGTPLRSVIWAANLPVAQIDSTPAGEDITYLHTDHLKTPRVGTDRSGTVVWYWQGEAFGATTANEDPDGDGISTVINLRFPGQYYDQETGFHYNWHRYYDPSTGRYITSDPIGLKGGLNTFGYVGANPIKRYDANGLFYNPNIEFGPLGSTNPAPVFNFSIGAGGSGMFMTLNTSADSGISIDTTGTICIYSTICGGVGMQTPIGGQLGLVGSVGKGKICDSQNDYTGLTWTGGQGIVGQGQLLEDGTYNRMLLGIGGSPEGAAAGVSVVNCTITYICPFQ